jgi:UPF0489 domain
MQRILDLDLDFFLDDAAILRGPDDGRLDGAWFPPWPLEQVLTFLHDQCGLRGPLPGFVVENHGELFPRWREAIDARQLDAPFHVTHVDAHADLGLGDSGYVYLMTSLLFEEPEKRRHPRTAKARSAMETTWRSRSRAAGWQSSSTYTTTAAAVTTSSSTYSRDSTHTPGTSNSPPCVAARSSPRIS